MLKLLIRLGAIYAAFQIGREYGRAETEIMLLPPVSYERRPSLNRWRIGASLQGHRTGRAGTHLPLNLSFSDNALALPT